MEEVKKNVKTFLEILQIGKSESVIHWDESNFERAQRWARYAEEVYKKLRNKPSLMEVLSNYIKQVGMAFTFNDLQHASEKLRHVLLRNSHLSSAQFSHVLDLYQVNFSALSGNEDLEKLFLDTYSISCSKGTFLTLSSIKDKLAMEHPKEGCKGLMRGTDDTSLDTCAKLLWENIRNLIEKQKESRSSDDSVIKKKLEALVLCSEKGMEVVLRMLVLSTKGEIPVNNASNDEVLDQMKDYILHWIVECSKQNGTENYERTWSCPSSLLCEVSALNNSFCESYLTFLHSWGDSLLGIGCVKVGDDQTSYGSCYRHICDHFQLLMQGLEHVSVLCKQKLKLWSIDPAGSLLMSETSILRNEKLRANLWKNIYHETCK